MEEDRSLDVDPTFQKPKTSAVPGGAFISIKIK